MLSIEDIRLAYSIYDDLLLYFPLGTDDAIEVRWICKQYRNGIISEKDAKSELLCYFFRTRCC